MTTYDHAAQAKVYNVNEKVPPRIGPAAFGIVWHLHNPTAQEI